MQSTLDRSRLPVYGGYGVNSIAYFWNSTDTSPDVDNIFFMCTAAGASRICIRISTPLFFLRAIRMR